MSRLNPQLNKVGGLLVGLLGIEPSPRVPKTRVLPVYYSPILAIPYHGF